MTEIYIAFVDTPGIFASIIRRVIKQKYIHVAIGLDENLDEAYSIGRRHPSIPLIAGFEKATAGSMKFMRKEKFCGHFRERII